ncbi:hypothetical protein, partial [Mycobacterium sp.]|uniref:hypothetical protein n=1 Tax=Mycobacterium sp. TaxID=1785 RepID=UPI003C726CDB
MSTKRGQAQIFAAGAIAVGATILSPAAANADPNNNPNKPRTEKAIEADCDDAGGTYGSIVDKKGKRTSTCSYLDSDGNGWTDNYTNGVYTGTTGPYKPKPTATTPPSAVILPPAANSIQ